MKLIVFTSDIGGHNLEYIHHLYDLAIKSPQDSFVFLLPASFNEIRGKFEWRETCNISFDLYERYQHHSSKSLFGLIRDSYETTKFVSQRAKHHQAKVVFVNKLISFVPWAPLLFARDIKLMGVIYRIYLYDMEDRSKCSVFLDKIKYYIMSRTKVFLNVLILNDKDGADRLNNIYNTKKFVHLPDPYVPIPTKNLPDFRKVCTIPKDKIMFVQFGALSINKSTIEILESLKSLKEEECKQYVFVFAGKVYDEIKQRFYELVDELKDTIQIVVKDEYCSYETFGSLCIACDAILTPYKRVAQSSGLIGYGAQFNKPVIAPNKGLLGSIVNKYKLGLLIDNISTDCLLQAYRKVESGEVEKLGNTYCQDNSIESFQRTISDIINRLKIV